MMFGKQQAPPVEGPLTYESLRAWMVADLARRLRCAPSEIDTSKPFDALGLDSRNAVQISGALQKVVGRRLSPAVLFDHATIDDLADFLAGELELPGRTGGLDPVP
jgi:acyl carrier protein